ncbi:unnamed protein product [Darwinula stevensoni]|uniref:Uncharacterized protein n=1 Tax=Darwinula stevensoni TaxID=69355 RepID=A0A7R9ACN9_9CRUS|nr:unnamed protein product [Darwinula stevensoni]CAG0900559.1 unnamed protein product [Darwinula stevensoni]
MGSRVGVWVFLKELGMSTLQSLHQWIRTRWEHIIPSIIRLVWRSLLAGDRAIVSLLEGYVDTVASIFVIIFIILCFMVAIIIATLQVHDFEYHMPMSPIQTILLKS